MAADNIKLWDRTKFHTKLLFSTSHDYIIKSIIRAIVAFTRKCRSLFFMAASSVCLLRTTGEAVSATIVSPVQMIPTAFDVTITTSISLAPLATTWVWSFIGLETEKQKKPLGITTFHTKGMRTIFNVPLINSRINNVKGLPGWAKQRLTLQGRQLF